MKKFAIIMTILWTADQLSSAADVKENWGKACSNCHGMDGKGQTKLGKKAGAKDFTDVKVQSSFTDEKAFIAIKDGLLEGDKVRMKPAEKLTDEEIKALVKYVRDLKK